jgi:hypothetical protein
VRRGAARRRAGRCAAPPASADRGAGADHARGPGCRLTLRAGQEAAGRQGRRPLHRHPRRPHHPLPRPGDQGGRRCWPVLGLRAWPGMQGAGRAALAAGAVLQAAPPRCVAAGGPRCAALAAEQQEESGGARPSGRPRSWWERARAACRLKVQLEQRRSNGAVLKQPGRQQLGGQGRTLGRHQGPPGPGLGSIAGWPA